MFVKQLYTNCLAEAAYYIGSNGEAAIIDPLRDVDQYIEMANERNETIKYIFETHFHADFVSGHIDLAQKTGAKIIFGPTAKTEFEIHQGKDNEVFKLGEISLTLLHTPGHTPESSCFLLKDPVGIDKYIFTGDTLFIGDVGRPDLLDGKMTKEELASMLYDSLNNKVKPLADEIIVYPGHGAGSACGKNISKETFSTLGQQKLYNYALREMTRDEFIHKVIEGLSAPPAYFFKDAAMNKKGYESFDELISIVKNETDPVEFKVLWESGLEILDARSPGEFEKGYIPGSLNVGINGDFAPWVGQLLDPQKPFLVILEKGKGEETITRLTRIGFDNIRGFMTGIEEWKKFGYPIELAISIEADSVLEKMDDPNMSILDVRKPGELSDGVVKGSVHQCLSALKDYLPELDKNKSWFVHCAGGYRSMMALSLIKKAGFDQVININGGYGAIKKTAIPQQKPEAV